VLFALQSGLSVMEGGGGASASATVVTLVWTHLIIHILHFVASGWVNGAPINTMRGWLLALASSRSVSWLLKLALHSDLVWCKR
jgi:hypothetical protein